MNVTCETKVARQVWAALLTSFFLLPPAGAEAPKAVSLQEAYRLAVQSNPTIQLLKQRVAQAEAARRRAWSSIKPTATFQGTFTHFDQEIAIDFAASSPVPLPGVEPIVIQKQNQFGLQGLAALPLFRGPAYQQIGLAKKAVELAQLSQVRSQNDFLLRVAQTYYQVVSMEEAVSALEHKLAVDEKHLAAARAQLEVGQAPRSIVLRADLVVTQDRQRLYAQRNTLEAARRTLSILIGVEQLVEVNRPAAPSDPTQAEQDLTRQALAQRPDLAATEVSLAMAEQSRQAVWWSFLPALDLSWLYRWSEAAGFAGKKDSWNLMLTLTVPLYDAGLRYADLHDTQARILEAQAQRAALSQQVSSEVVRLRAEVASANAGVIAASKAMDLAITTQQDMEASFEVGAVTQLDVLDASQRLLEAELQLTQSLYDRDLSRLSLAHSLGQFDPIRRNR